jgi:hypothetical protein
VLVDGAIDKAGSAFTVTTTVDAQPEDNEYDIVDVPAETAVTRPVLLILQTVSTELLHVPPDVVLVNNADVPAHNEEEPTIEAGAASTVATVVYVRTQPEPVPLLTVRE